MGAVTEWIIVCDQVKGYFSSTQVKIKVNILTQIDGWDNYGLDTSSDQPHIS